MELYQFGLSFNLLQFQYLSVSIFITANFMIQWALKFVTFKEQKCVRRTKLTLSKYLKKIFDNMFVKSAF